ncbi:phasin [Amorphus orientalis]|uniref:Phasin n=1 Tax=Amorphus orientalis TaxID=649198 RepID=A0AAE3VRG9_9HYPH|nr:phasin [Amorphus orientalis]MDQ0317012.1 phasin [Amorphus orientalis]
MTEKKTQSTATKDPVKKTAKAADAAIEAAPSAENVTPFPGFATQNLEIPDTVREMAEQHVERARKSYETLKNAAEEATDMMEDAYENTRQGFVDLNLKALDNAKSNTDRAFSFAKEFVAAKSVSEAVELQTKFAREQFESFSSQMKEMQELTTKLASESSAPMKDAWEKTQEKMKVA